MLNFFLHFHFGPVGPVSIVSGTVLLIFVRRRLRNRTSGGGGGGGDTRLILETTETHLASVSGSSCSNIIVCSPSLMNQRRSETSLGYSSLGSPLGHSLLGLSPRRSQVSEDPGAGATTRRQAVLTSTHF